MVDPTRKSIDDLKKSVTPIIHPNHVEGWNYCHSDRPFKAITSLYPELRGSLNLHAAVSAPKSIRFRQFDHDFGDGVKGDYMFMDAGGGKMILPYVMFKHLFS